TVWRQGRLFGEKPGGTQTAIDLVGGHLQEARHFELASGVEQDLRADDVGSHKGSGIHNAAIDMALGREVDDARNALGYDLLNNVAVSDVAMDEAIARIAGDVLQIGQVSGIGEQVEIDDAYFRVRFKQVANEVA